MTAEQRAAASEQVITALCVQVGRLGMRVAELELEKAALARMLEQAQSVAIGRVAASGAGPGGAWRS